MYIIINAVDQEQLAMKVNKHLKDGWICTGGVSAVLIDIRSFRLWFYQAMIKTKPSI